MNHESPIHPATTSGPSIARSRAHRPRPRRKLVVVGLVAGLIGLVGAACGSSNDSNTSPTSEAPRGAQQGTVPEDTAKPVPGGKVVYGLEAESDGFNPTVNRWAISGVMIGLAVYDPLAAYNDKSEAKPYLAESITPNKEYTEWTITLRPDVKFSNGTALTAEAVKATLEGHLASGLTKPVFSPIESVTVSSPLVTVVKMKSPWVVFPSTLTAQTGVVPEPSTIPDKTGANPIGTGPFVQTGWTPNDKWTGTRNPGYWRKDKDGVQLPYLAELEFQPIVEPTSRVASLKANDIQMMHSSEVVAIKQVREKAADGSIKIYEDAGEGEEGFVIMNNKKAPFDDVNMRRALAYATDTVDYGDIVNEGVLEVANGPFRANSRWHADTTNYPEFDLAKAKSLVDGYKAAHGGEAPTFAFGITPDNRLQAGYLEQAWKQAGFVVTVEEHEQGPFIQNAVFGAYQANLWRQFGAPDPDADLLWWTSANAGNDDGTGIALNIARHKSPCVDKALQSGRENIDDAIRKKAYADLQQCWADEVPYVFLDHTVWVLATSSKVHNALNGPLPDNEASLPMGGAGDFGGVTRLTQVWIEH